MILPDDKLFIENEIKFDPSIKFYIDKIEKGDISCDVNYVIKDNGILCIVALNKEDNLSLFFETNIIKINTDKFFVISKRNPYYYILEFILKIKKYKDICDRFSHNLLDENGRKYSEIKVKKYRNIIKSIDFSKSLNKYIYEN